MASERLSFAALHDVHLGALKSAVDAWTSTHTELEKIAAGGDGATAGKLEHSARAADWAGDNAAVSKDFTERTAEQIRRMVGHAHSVREALSGAHTTLTIYHELLQKEIEQAPRQDVRVTKSGAVEPLEGKEPPQSAIDAVADAIREILTKAGEANAAARKQLRKLAHDRYDFTRTTAEDRNLLQEIVKAATDKVNPPDDGLELAGWGLGHFGTAAGATTSWFADARYGRFAPRVNGQFAPIAPTVLGRTRQAMNTGNFRATPNAAGTRAAWMSGGKWLGRAGGVVGIGTSGLSQWNADDGKGYATDERVGRAATRGAVAGGAAWAGAAGGAQLGGAIGTAVGGPVGTVVGGAVGGLAGGIIGSGVGNEIADHVVDFGGEVGDLAGDGLSKVGDGLSKAGDTLKFWD